MTSNKRNMIFVAILFIGFTLFILLNGTESVSINSDETNLTLHGPDDSECIIPYKSIASIDFVENADFSAFHGGLSKNNLMYGIWSSDSLGSCQFFANSKISSYIVISSNNQIVIFNYENNETTSALYQKLIEFWQEQN